MRTLFDDFDEQLNAQGYKARKGQIVDASFVDVPKQRNSRAENEPIKAGEILLRQKTTRHKLIKCVIVML